MSPTSLFCSKMLTKNYPCHRRVLLFWPFHIWAPWQGRCSFFSERPSTPQRQISSTVSCVGTWQQFGVASHSRLAHQYCCLGSLCFRDLKFYEMSLRVSVSATWLPEKNKCSSLLYYIINITDCVLHYLEHAFRDRGSCLIYLKSFYLQAP
jgi:hypothetical protein